MVNARQFHKWDPAVDDAALKRLDAQRLTINTIALRMGRSRATILKHAGRLGVHLRRYKDVRPWSATDDDELEAMVDGDMSGRVIAAELGRTTSAVRQRCYKLGLTLPRHSRKDQSCVPPAPEGPLAEAVQFLQRLHFKVHRASVLKPGAPSNLYRVDSREMEIPELLALAAKKGLAI